MTSSIHAVDGDAASDGGYATPVALVIALSVALVASALTAKSVIDLRVARADLERTQVEYGLDAAQLVAGLTVEAQTTPSRLAWPVSVGGVDYAVLAEPEALKVNAAAMTPVDDGALAALGVSEPAALRDRLRGLAAAGPMSTAQLAQASGSRNWRDCAASIVSPYGGAPKPLTTKAIPPQTPIDETAGSHAGEIWRVRVKSRQGWIDDRVVRLNGEADHPTIILDRRFYRGARGGDLCEQLIVGIAH